MTTQTNNLDFKTKKLKGEEVLNKFLKKRNSKINERKTKNKFETKKQKAKIKQWTNPFLNQRLNKQTTQLQIKPIPIQEINQA